MLILRIVVFVVGAYFGNKSIEGAYFNPKCEFFLIGLIFGVVVTIPGVYAVSFSGGVFLDTLALNGIVRNFVNIVFLWQGAYLMFMLYAFKDDKRPQAKGWK